MASKKENLLPHIFGPIPSRRLGLSLGLDLVPFKTCSLNCAYCECGKTTDFTIKRAPFVPAEVLIKELDLFFSSTKHKIDAITFTGSGEPTLNSDLNKVLVHIKNRYPSIKTALLTNSTLLHLLEVRKEIIEVDFVLPSLDAVSEIAFKKINNPAKNLTSKMVIDGLLQFSKEFSNTLWVEVFILPNINDSKEEISKLKNLLTNINPTRVQLNTLDRPGAFDWVESASKISMAKIASFLAPLPVEIISRATAPVIPLGKIAISEEEILSAIKRRPLTVEDISITTGMNINEADEVITSLLNKKLVSMNINSNGKFFRYNIK